MDKTLNTEKKAIIFEISYYIFFSILLFLQFMETTMIDISKYRQILKFALLFFGIILVAKIALEWTSAWDIKAAFIALVCVCGLLFPILNYLMDLTVGLCLLILASRNISSKKTLIFYAVISTILTAFVVIYCLAGKVDNFVVYRDALSTHKRQALGFVYATYLSAHIMGICVAWSFVRGRVISWFESTVMIILGIYTYYLTEARISCAVIVVTGITMAISKFVYIKDIKVKLTESKIIQWILVLSADIIALFSIVLGVIYKYGNPFFETLNKIASTRLNSNALTFDRYDVTLWGQRITFVGNYLSDQRGVADNYYMVNCSYILILFHFGVAGLIAVLVGWTLLSYRASKKNEIYKLIMLSVLSVYFFFEQRMIIFCIIPFWVLLLSDKNVEFFEIGKFSFIKKIVRYKEKLFLVFSMAILAILVDLVVFNSSCIMTIMNEPINHDEISINANGFNVSVDGKYFIDRENLYEGDEPYILMANIISPVGIESFEFGLNFYKLTEDGDYVFEDNVNYSYDIVALGDDGTFNKLRTVECNSSKPITWYTKLEIDSVLATFYVYPHFEESYIFDIKNLDVNGPVPYDFNPGRLALIWLILSALALVLSSGKKPENKDDEGSEDDSKEEITDNTEADTSKEVVEEEPESTTAAEKV